MCSTELIQKGETAQQNQERDPEVKIGSDGEQTSALGF
jgi:hypothetical protein